MSEKPSELRLVYGDMTVVPETRLIAVETRLRVLGDLLHAAGYSQGYSHEEALADLVVARDAALRERDDALRALLKNDLSPVLEQAIREAEAARAEAAAMAEKLFHAKWLVTNHRFGVRFRHQNDEDVRLYDLYWERSKAWLASWPTVRPEAGEGEP